MDDLLERKSALKELFNTFQKPQRNDFIETTLRQTAFISITKFMDAIEELKREEAMPYNLTKKIKDIYYKHRPAKAHTFQCGKCGNIGLIYNELHEPYFEWVEPCTCKYGDQHEWMNRDIDTGTYRYLKSRGVKFAQIQQGPETPYDF